MPNDSKKHKKLYVIRSKQTNDTLGIIAAEYETDTLSDGEDRAAYFDCWAVWQDIGFANGSVFYPIFKAHVRWDAETRLQFADDSTPNFYMSDNFIAYLTTQHCLDYVARDILGKDFIDETYDEEFKLWDGFQNVLRNNLIINEFLDKDTDNAKISFEEVQKIFTDHVRVETDD